MKRSCSMKHELLGDDTEEHEFKAAVLRVSPSVVSLVSLGVPFDMTFRGAYRKNNNFDLLNAKRPQQVYAFTGQGTIIECEKNADDDKFSTTIITCATLFTRTNGVQPQDIKVEVYLAKGTMCEGKVLACDFHYNLALVTVQMDTPLQPAKLRDLDDIMSTHVTDSQPFQLRRHSSSFKICPGDKIASLARSTKFDFSASFGQFSASYPRLDCKELYSISSKDQVIRGSPVFNCHGEVIGIFATPKSFLPSNIVSRWWNYYKNFKKYCRPCLGLNVANLRSAKFSFLEPFVLTFPNVSSGVIVTKVEENSVAHRSGLRMEDVIVKCNGATVGSTLDLFDKIWDKVGAPVELSLLRKTGHVNVRMTVDEATPANFYRWPIPIGGPRPGVDSTQKSDPDSEMLESSHISSNGDEKLLMERPKRKYGKIVERRRKDVLGFD